MSAPFGIQFFSPLDRLQTLNDFGQGKFQVTAPSPHPLFATYIVQATPSLGIVWIKATTPVAPVDAFGNSLRGEVDRVAQQLSLKYGQAERPI